MQDKEPYQKIPGLSYPWQVASVELDHAEERRWRQLDSCQYKTMWIARQTRLNSPSHRVKAVIVPGAEKHGRCTLMFVRFAIDVLQAPYLLQKAAERGKARKLNILYLGLESIRKRFERIIAYNPKVELIHCVAA